MKTFEVKLNRHDIERLEEGRIIQIEVAPMETQGAHRVPCFLAVGREIPDYKQVCAALEDILDLCNEEGADHATVRQEAKEIARDGLAGILEVAHG